MIQIRKGVFETNSSSSHSIVITKAQDTKVEVPEDDWRISNGEIYLWDSDLEFGRAPFNLLIDWYGRLCYALASYGEDKIEEIEEACYRHIPNLKKIKYPTQYSYTTGEEQVFYGYVDHQSMGLLQGFLKNHNISLEDFIFDDRYIVVIDGDEYNVFDTFMKTPLFNPDAVENINDYKEEEEDDL